jgi:hypothetical protein
MRNRFIAAVLSLTLCASALSISASAASDNPAFTPDNPPAAQETTAPESSVKPDPEGTVSYANLEQRMRENNPTVRMLQANIEVINDNDYDKIYDKLRDGLALSAKMRWGLLQNSLYAPETELGNSYISSTLASSSAS